MKTLLFTYERYTDQVKRYMTSKGVKKSHLADEIGLARVTFDKRLAQHNWKISELETLAQLGVI